uniref:Transmembrane protein n=1 Tax=Neospora caninum (strain Liverpool) TaxID=572307 RepID=A0A0F7UFF7_NEOCL|nr:TPA: hypothetical protein BN1204_043875 [Neospora caninum Liverpool]
MFESSEYESIGQVSTSSHRKATPPLRLWFVVAFVVASNLVFGCLFSVASWASVAPARPPPGVAFPGGFPNQHPVIRVGGGTSISKLQRPPAMAIVGPQLQAGALSHLDNVATLSSTLLRGGDGSRSATGLPAPNGQSPTSTNAPMYVLAPPLPFEQGRLDPARNHMRYYADFPFSAKDVPQFEGRLSSSPMIQAGDWLATRESNVQRHSLSDDAPAFELHPRVEVARQGAKDGPSDFRQGRENRKVVPKLVVTTVAGDSEEGPGGATENATTDDTAFAALAPRSARERARDDKRNETELTLSSDKDVGPTVHDPEGIWTSNDRTDPSSVGASLASAASASARQNDIGPAQEVVCPIHFTVPQLCFSDLDCPLPDPDQDGLYICSTLTPRIEGIPGVCRLTCDGSPTFPCPVGQVCSASMDVAVCVEFCPPDGNPPCDRVSCGPLEYCTRNWCRTQGALLDPSLCVPPFSQSEEEFFCTS